MRKRLTSRMNKQLSNLLHGVAHNVSINKRKRNLDKPDWICLVPDIPPTSTDRQACELLECCHIRVLPFDAQRRNQRTTSLQRLLRHLLQHLLQHLLRQFILQRSQCLRISSNFIKIICCRCFVTWYSWQDSQKDLVKRQAVCELQEFTHHSW